MRYVDIEEFDFCYNECIYHNHYDGWCNYYNEDVILVEYCNYYRQQVR